MYSDEDLDSAVHAGVLNATTARAFREHVAQRGRPGAVDEERFRLITGFNDIFVVIACALMLGSAFWIGQTWTLMAGGIAVAVVAWVLAEFFVRKRRMALPAIVLSLAFVASFAALGANSFNSLSAIPFAAFGCAAVAAGLYWWRFRVPIAIAAGLAAVLGLIGTFLFAYIPYLRDHSGAVFFGGGILAFIAAMYWDGKDTLRSTQRSDIAFWLHLLAAPLLVHPVFANLAVSDTPTVGMAQALAVVALYVVLGVVSLAIDRRALMVSALAYVLFTFTGLLQQYGVVTLSFAITALIIGSALLLLSAFWHPSRGFVLKFLPHSLRMRLPVYR